jgi:hypothetical protein
MTSLGRRAATALRRLSAAAGALGQPSPQVGQAENQPAFRKSNYGWPASRFEEALQGAGRAAQPSRGFVQGQMLACGRAVIGALGWNAID